MAIVTCSQKKFSTGNFLVETEKHRVQQLFNLTNGSVQHEEKLITTEVSMTCGFALKKGEKVRELLGLILIRLVITKGQISLDMLT